MQKVTAEILRYLGRRGQNVDDVTLAMTERAALECRKIAAPKHCLAVYDYKDGRLENCPLKLEGNSMKEYLAGAKKVCVMAATLGIEIERTISRAAYTDITYSVILDAAATQFIEEFCNGVQAEISRDMLARGLRVKPRFSPGYGDLPLSLQPQFLDAANARSIGLYCTENFILTPRKSVSAVIGVFDGGKHEI